MAGTDRGRCDHRQSRDLLLTRVGKSAWNANPVVCCGGAQDETDQRREIGSDALSYAAMASIVDLTLPADSQQSVHRRVPLQIRARGLLGVDVGGCAQVARHLQFCRPGGSQLSDCLGCRSVPAGPSCGLVLDGRGSADRLSARRRRRSRRRLRRQPRLLAFPAGTGSGNVVDLQGQYLACSFQGQPTTPAGFLMSPSKAQAGNVSGSTSPCVYRTWNQLFVFQRRPLR